MKRILIVVDMKKDFLDGALGTAEAQDIAPAVVAKITNFDGDIYATLDTHSADYMNTNEGKNLPVVHCIEGTDGWELDENIKSALTKRGYTPVKKPTFGSVVLPKMIKDKYDVNNIEIELIGVCTDICVVSNALILKANFPEINISVDSMCCAGVTPELHNSALNTMKSCQIVIK